MKWLPPDCVGELAARGTTAHRICSDRDAWIERFGNTAVISVKEPAEANPLGEELDAWELQAGLKLVRRYQRLLVPQPREKDRFELLRGDSAQAPTEIVQEEGLLFEVDFSIGYSTGLFCDQRANRLYLRSLAPRKVLNTFAYTCAFSVAAARAGAETLSIDLSKSSLTRGRKNFSLNGLETRGHRFWTGDVLQTLRRLARNDEKFDTIILDPPTFGRSSPRRAFRAARDYEDLIALALECALPGADLLLSTNCSSLRAEKLRSMAARVTRGKASFHGEPAQEDFPPGHGAESLWMRWEKPARGRRR